MTSAADHPSIAAPRTILVPPSNPRKVMGRFHKQLLEAVGVARFRLPARDVNFLDGISFGIKHGHNVVSLQCDSLERHVARSADRPRNCARLNPQMSRASANLPDENDCL